MRACLLYAFLGYWSLSVAQAANDTKWVTSTALQAEISQENIQANLQKLNDIAYANGGNRAFGNPGYAASVDWIYEEISQLNQYDVWKQDFYANYTEVLSISLTAGGTEYYVFGLTYSPSTSAEGITAELVLGVEGPGGCVAGFYDDLDVTGKIVLVQRGSCPDGTTFAGRIKPAAAAGAAAVIVYNNVATRVTAGTLSAPNPAEYVPAGSIDLADGEALKARLQAGEVIEATFQQTQIVEERITQNVFAETRLGDADNVVVLGAHLDSVKAGPGVNDDGSGTSLILQLASALNNFKTKLKVRFAWWGAEEDGLLGSEFYCNNLAQAEADQILTYLNFDMVSKGYYGVFDGDGTAYGTRAPPGSEVIQRLFKDDFVAKGFNVTAARLTNGSDYASFWQILNKPFGGLHTGTGIDQDPCYHQACDNITNPDFVQITNNAKAAAHVLSILAIDGVELIPRSEGNQSTSVIGRAQAPPEYGWAEVEEMEERHLPTCGHEV